MACQKVVSKKRLLPSDAYRPTLFNLYTRSVRHCPVLRSRPATNISRDCPPPPLPSRNATIFPQKDRGCSPGTTHDAVSRHCLSADQWLCRVQCFIVAAVMTNKPFSRRDTHSITHKQSVATRLQHDHQNRPTD